MSGVHGLKVRAPLDSLRTELELDGEPLRGVVAYRIEGDVRGDRRTRVTLVMDAEVDIEAVADLRVETEGSD